MNVLKRQLGYYEQDIFGVVCIYLCGFAFAALFARQDPLILQSSLAVLLAITLDIACGTQVVEEWLLKVTLPLMIIADAILLLPPLWAFSIAGTLIQSIIALVIILRTLRRLLQEVKPIVRFLRWAHLYQVSNAPLKLTLGLMIMMIAFSVSGAPLGLIVCTSLLYTLSIIVLCFAVFENENEWDTLRQDKLGVMILFTIVLPDCYLALTGASGMLYEVGLIIQYCATLLILAFIALYLVKVQFESRF